MKKRNRIERQCRACKHMERDEIIGVTCRRPHPRTGEPIEGHHTDCQYQRSHGNLMSKFKGTCGKEARFFVDKDEWPEV